MKIKASANIIKSERDYYGNVYNYTSVVNNETGESFTYSDSTDNITGYFREAGYNFGEFKVYELVLPKRTYKAKAKVNNVSYIAGEQVIEKLKAWL